MFIFHDTHDELIVVDLRRQWVNLIVDWRVLNNVIRQPESKSNCLMLDDPPLILN